MRSWEDEKVGRWEAWKMGSLEDEKLKMIYEQDLTHKRSDELRTDSITNTQYPTPNDR